MSRNGVLSNREAIKAVSIIRETCPEQVLFNDRFERFRKLVFKFGSSRKARKIMPALKHAGIAFEVPPRTEGLAVVIKTQPDFSFRAVK